MFEYRSFCHRLFLDPAPCWSSDPAFSRQFRANDMSEHWKRLGDPMCPTILVYDDMTYTAHLGTHTKFGKMIKKSSCFFGGCRLFFWGMPFFSTLPLIPPSTQLHLGQRVASGFPTWNQWKKTSFSITAATSPLYHHWLMVAISHVRHEIHHPKNLYQPDNSSPIHRIPFALGNLNFAGKSVMKTSGRCAYCGSTTSS